MPIKKENEVGLVIKFKDNQTLTVQKVQTRAELQKRKRKNRKRKGNYREVSIQVFNTTVLDSLAQVEKQIRTERSPSRATCGAKIRQIFEGVGAALAR